MPKGIKGFQEGNKINLDRKHEKEHKQKIGNTLKKAHQSKNFGFQKGNKLGRAHKGKHPKNKSLFKKGIYLGYGFKKGVYTGHGFKKGNKLFVGEKNPMWKGGISNNPYPKEFNAELKLKIRIRDNFTCCLCGKTEREELEELNRTLCINHIDFNKNNCKESNLNTLCLRCNVKINREREYWIEYFKII